MTKMIIGAVVLGIIVGRVGLFSDFFASMDNLNTYLLCLLLLVVGMDLGRNKEIWTKLRKMGIRVLAIPLSVATGSLVGAIIVGIFMGLTATQSMAVGAGFGWYSLSGILIQEMGNVELGAIALLANVFREVIALLTIPYLAVKLGKIVCIAPGGATTMDTTLPLISKAGGSDIALLGFINGAILTMLVPILVPFICSFGI